MPVSGIDHVNILTDDLDASALFYEQLLGLSRTDNPAIGAGFKGAWMRDDNGDAIVHLVWRDPEMERYAGYVPGGSTNAVHHVALRCRDFDDMRDRVERLGVPCRVNDLQHMGLRQIFLVDPNAVNLELNFSGV